MYANLSYPALLCVLEFMEANKRIYTAFRCLSIRTFEKTIPLRLELLSLSESNIDVNRMMHHVTRQFEQVNNLEPGDLVTNPPFRRKTVVHWLHFECDGRKRRRRVPDGMDMQTATRKMIEGILGERKTIIVNAFFNSSSNCLHLPVGLTKFRVNKLYSGKADHRFLLPLIDESSCPLKVLQTRLSSAETLDNIVALTATELIISKQDALREQEYMDYIINLPHNNVIIEKCQTSTILGILRAWIDKGKEVGTCYRFDCENHQVAINWLDFQLKGRGATKSILEQFLNIPINATSKIIICGAMRKIPSQQRINEFEDVAVLEIWVVSVQPTTVVIATDEAGDSFDVVAPPGRNALHLLQKIEFRFDIFFTGIIVSIAVAWLMASISLILN